MSETLEKNQIKQYLHLLINLIFILVLSLMAAPVFADDVMAKGEETSCLDGSSDGSGKSTAGKPVNLFTGSETLSRTDLTIGTLHPITVQPRYNSTAVYDSPLGYGWALNYDKRLYTYPGGSITIRKDCGQKVRFTWSASGFVPPSGEYGTLSQNVDGTYTYSDKYGSKESYDVYGRIVSAMDAKGNSLVFTYGSDTRGPLTGLSLFHLDQTTSKIVSYDYRLTMIEERDSTGTATGSRVTFSYDLSTGRLNGIWDNTGRSVSYSHDAIGNLTGVSGTSGIATYGYNSSNNRHSLTNIYEGRGEYVNSYDDKSRVYRQTHANGVIDIEYLPDQKVKVTTTVKDPEGTTLNIQVRTVEFNDKAKVIKNTDTFGNVTNYIRDLQTSKITREEYWENTGSIDAPNLVLKAATDYAYDAYGNIKTKIEASNPNSSDWDAIKKTTWYYYVYELDETATPATFNKIANEIVTSVVDPAQYRYVKYNYDNNTGNLLTMIEMGLLGDGTAYTYTTTYDYYSNGLLKSIDGPRTDVQDITTFTYDPITNYRTSMTQPIIGTTTYSSFDSHGNPQTVTDPNGNSTSYTYDDSGRVTSVKAAGDTAATQYFYVSGSCGQSCGGTNKIDYILLPEGNTINYAYDIYGNLSAISDNAGNSINYTYDSEGNKLTEDIKDSGGALQKTLSYQYDALNRLKQVKNPDTTYTEYAYDSRGNRISLRTPNSALTTYSYDALNRVISVIQPGSILTKYGYNSNNNLTTVTDANNNVTTYRYDDKGRVYQTISPDTGTTTYQYDPAGNMISKTDAKGITISYVYDALNRLTKIDFPTDTDVVYGYENCVNGTGRICSMTDASGTTTYEYTPKGQVKKETKVIDSVTYVTQYTYDMNGNIKTMTYPGGRVVTYNYTNDRVVSVLNNAANLATNINYKPFGGMSSVTYGNGIAGTISYDNQYRISGIQAGAVLNLSYGSYDANGNITGITNTLDPTQNKTFGYDALDRLTSANASGIWGSLGWTYDEVGNRLTENSTAYIYVTGSNKLSTVGGISYGFDNNGNTTAEGTRAFTYNQNQRLDWVTEGMSIFGVYLYNGNGQRVKKLVNGTTTIFHYNLTGQIMAESDSAGTISTEYVYLNGQPLAKIEGANTYYYHNDHLGTPQKLTDSTGTVVWAADYKPFGEATVTVSTITNNLRFPGQYYDAETGLHYNYYRDYNPLIGRYSQADPLGLLKGSNHLFVYGLNNPVNRSDFYGLVSTPDVIAYLIAAKTGYEVGQVIWELSTYLPMYNTLTNQADLIEEMIKETEAKIKSNTKCLSDPEYLALMKKLESLQKIKAKLGLEAIAILNDHAVLKLYFEVIKKALKGPLG